MALVGLCVCFSFPCLLAQPGAARSEDHFHRRRVVLRMDLNEKINRPLVTGLQTYGEADPASGLIGTLMRGLEKGAYSALDPDDLRRILTYEDVLSRLAEVNDSPDPVMGWGDEASFPEDPFAPAPVDDSLALDGGAAPEPAPESVSYLDCEQSLQIVEDWIFDKNRSQMIYRPRYIEMIWTDPNGALPERVIAVFRYDDLLPTLEEGTWVNRHNDAEHRNLREIFELRLWHAYVIEISGYKVYSLAEAQYRREAMIAYEHHLWSY